MSAISKVAACAAVVCLTLAPASIGHAAVAPPQAHGTPRGAPPTPKSPATPKGAAPTTVVQHISANPALVARLQPLLPANMTLEQAADGFRNQGQFIAALHVSHNLNIPFVQLKSEMTDPNHESLGQAIQALMPTASAKTEAKKAQDEANEDLKTSSKSPAAKDRQ